MEREMRQVLAEMSVLSYGATTRFDKSGGKSSEHPGGKQPSGDSNPLHDVFGREWRAATTEADRARILGEAREALQNARKRAEGAYTEETWEQLRDRIVKEGEGFSLRDVAVAFKRRSFLIAQF